MKTMKTIRRFAIILYSMGFVLVASTSLFAEAIALKSGIIVEGKIITNTVNTVVIEVGGKKQTFSAADIQQIFSTNDWKEKKYIHLKNNTVVEGYITGEDRVRHFVRKKLTDTVPIPVNKTDIAFISRKKISELIEAPAIVGKGRDMFKNLLGVRLITGIALSPMIYSTDLTPSAFYLKSYPIGFGLFYYDKYFDVDFEFFPTLGGVSGISLIMNGLPLNMFGIGLGISLGYMEYKEWSVGNFAFIGTPPVAGSALPPYYTISSVQGMFLGLTYRVPNLLRAGVGYLISFGNSFDLVDRNGSRYNYNSSGGDAKLNIYTFIEFWVWRELSVRLSYIIMESKGSGSSPAPLIPATYFQSHIIFLSVGYAFKLSDK